MNFHINAKELHDAYLNGCIKSCKKCKLNINGKCLLNTQKKWEEWNRKQKEQFNISMEAIDGQGG